MYIVFNDRFQYQNDFDTYEEAQEYLNENEPCNEFWTIGKVEFED